MSLDPLAPFRLDERVAIVTGASSGLGRRFAQVLSAVGASIVVAARRRDRLDDLAAELPTALVVEADLSLPADRERLVASTLDRFGQVDVLVNNAGVTDPKPIEDETLEDFDYSMNLNLTAPWHLTQIAGASMVERGRGSVINISSIYGLVASAPIKQSRYSASKGGLIRLTSEVAVQWARKGVRVNAICPGWFRTEMTDGMEDDPASRKYLTANTPMGRMADVEELDGALLLLASDAGSFITGQTLVVDGGWVAR